MVMRKVVQCRLINVSHATVSQVTVDVHAITLAHQVNISFDMMLDDNENKVHRHHVQLLS